MRFDKEPIQMTFKEGLSILGIKGMFFDLDDTVIRTDAVFKTKLGEFYTTVADRFNRPRDEFEKTFKRANNEAYLTHSVGPKKWDHLRSVLAPLFGSNSSEFVELYDRTVLDIYTSVPDFQDGAEEVLKEVASTDLVRCIVTHSPEKWTWIKYDGLRLGRFYDKEDIVIVDPDGPKTSEDWRRPIIDRDLTPQQCLIAGDNLKGDINPAIEIGALAVHVKADTWSMYRGDAPDGTMTISGIRELPQAIIDKALNHRGHLGQIIGLR